MAQAKKKAKKGGARGPAAPPEQVVSPRGQVERSFTRATRELTTVLRGLDATYKMPWFAMVGEPGAGKEDLLPASGLPARPGWPQDFGLKGPLANQWWLFNNAVVIDLSAQYFAGEQEDDEGGGGNEPKRGFFARLFRRRGGQANVGAWKFMLDTLRKNRRRRPLDGLILTLDVRTLKTQSPEQQSALVRRAEGIADRIYEAQFRLGVHFPVYVILTGCESLAGFIPFARALPDAMNDQMFGWSSPHETEESYQSEWIDEAVASIHESVCVTQLSVLPQVKNQADRDALYLLPRAVMDLRDGLSAYLDPIFKASSVRRGLPLRGIYMSARIPSEAPATKAPEARRTGAHPAAGTVAATVAAQAGAGKPRFVKQLFSEKIFQEPGLAKLDADQNRALTRAVRTARLALIITLAVAAVGIYFQRRMTTSRVDGFEPLYSVLVKYRTASKIPGATGSSQGLDTLEALATSDVDRLEVFPAPTSYFDSLSEDANAAIARVLGEGVGKPLHDELVRKADQVLPPALETELPNAGRVVKPMIDAPVTGVQAAVQTATRQSPEEQINDLKRFADDVVMLKANFERFKTHGTSDLGEIYLYLTGKDITATLAKQADVYKTAFANLRDWPVVSYERYGARARTRVGQLTDRFQTELFREHPLRSGLSDLAELIDTIDSRSGRETAYDRLVSIADAIKRVEQLIQDGRADWLLAEKFEPGPRYTDTVALLDGEAFPAPTKPAAGVDVSPLGTKFQSQNDKLFVDLRQFVLSKRSKVGDFDLLERREGKIVLSEPVVAVRNGLKEFLEQPYIVRDLTKFQLDLARDAGSREGWNADLLNTSLAWQKTFAAYAGAQRPGLPTAINSALDQAARRTFRDRVLQVMEFARPDSLFGGQEGSADWTAQRKDALKARVRNLADNYTAILKVISVLDGVSTALNEATDTRLFNSLRDDSLDLLNQVDSILEQEKLYLIRSDEFSWWEGDQPPGVVAFGARDTNDLLARLAVQRKVVQSLANEYARPLVEVMLKLGEPFSSDPDVEKWNRIISVLTDYEKKVPGNSLEEMERFVEVELNKIQLASCAEQLAGQTDRYNRDDFFKDRKFMIATAMTKACAQILKKVTLSGYVELQSFFEERLQGRFPFASADVQADAETKDIVEFYKKFDRYGGAFKGFTGSDDSGSGSASPRALFGSSSEEVVRFLKEVIRARELFAPLLSAEDQNSDLALDAEFDFRVNRDNEVNGNQIIAWWAQVADEMIDNRGNKRTSQWKTNDPVNICFRWAKDAMFIPATNQRVEHAKINGRTACYGAQGKWGLLRILQMHAVTPADRGRRSFLTPHTLRFETETSLASAAQGASTMLVTDTRVYVRVGLALPGGKSAYQMPDFPRRAPEINAEFLKANGVTAPSSKTNDSKAAN